jgi:hypothetical protein
MSGAVANAIERGIEASAGASALHSCDCSMQELLSRDLRRGHRRAAYQHRHTPKLVAAIALVESAEFPVIGARKMGVLRHKRKRSLSRARRLRIPVSHSNPEMYAAQGIINILFSLS